MKQRQRLATEMRPPTEAQRCHEAVSRVDAPTCSNQGKNSVCEDVRPTHHTEECVGECVRKQSSKPT